MPNFRQANFSGGEIAPALYGRSDIDRYWTSLRRCHNFLVTPQGSLVNRPGFLWSGLVLDTDPTHKVRLIPFVFGGDIAFVLEFGHLYCRVWNPDGTILQVPAAPGAVGPLRDCVVTMPYTHADLPRLKFAQVGDVITLVHPDHPPKELARSIVNYTP